MNQEYLCTQVISQGDETANPDCGCPTLRKVDIGKDYIAEGNTFVDVQEEGEGRVLEESLDHSVVQVVEDGPDYATDHPHAHFVAFGLEFVEEGGESADEGRAVEQVVLDHVLGSLGLVEDVGEIGLIG